MRRIAVIGADGSGLTTESARLQWFPWDKLQDLANLSEFDDVILSLLAKPPNDSIDWATFYQKVFTLRAVRDVLEHNGKIVVVGDPTFQIVSRTSMGREYAEPFLGWTGLKFVWDSRPGDNPRPAPQLTRAEMLLGRYLGYLKEWTNSLDRCELGDLLYELQDRYPGLGDRSKKRTKFRYELNTAPLMTNRSGGALAFVVTLEIYRDHLYEPRGMAYSVQPHWVSELSLGPFVFLPAIPLPEVQALAILLHDLCGLDLNTSVPTWVRHAIAPGQETIDAEIDRIDAQISALESARSDKQAERTAIRGQLGLLYESGEPLEKHVFATLEAMGAQVQRPDHPGREDGWFTVQLDSVTLQGVLEITGMGVGKRTFREDKLRQTKTWVDHGFQSRGIVYKGVFVLNEAPDLAIDERPNAFSSGQVRFARDNNIVAITTSDLHIAHRLLNLDRLMIEEFWQEVFSTAGVFDGTKYRELLMEFDGGR